MDWSSAARQRQRHEGDRPPNRRSAAPPDEPGLAVDAAPVDEMAAILGVSAEIVEQFLNEDQAGGDQGSDVETDDDVGSGSSSDNAPTEDQPPSPPTHTASVAPPPPSPEMAMPPAVPAPSPVSPRHKGREGTVVGASNCLDVLANASSVQEVCDKLPFDLTPQGDVIPRGVGQVAARLGRIRTVGFGFMATTCSKHGQCTLKLDCTGEAFERMQVRSFLWLVSGSAMNAGEHSRASSRNDTTRREELRASRARA